MVRVTEGYINAYSVANAASTSPHVLPNITRTYSAPVPEIGSFEFRHIVEVSAFGRFRTTLRLYPAASSCSQAVLTHRAHPMYVIGRYRG